MRKALTKEYTVEATIATDFKVKATDDVTLVVDGRYQGIKDVSDAEAYTGNGVLTEVYKVDGKLHVVVINTYIDRIASVNSRKGTATIGTYEAFKNTDGFKANEVVLYRPCNKNAVEELKDLNGGNLHDVYAAEVKQLTVDESWTNKP